MVTCERAPKVRYFSRDILVRLWSPEAPRRIEPIGECKSSTTVGLQWLTVVSNMTACLVFD